MEDFGGRFIPSAQDFLQSMDALPWMDGRGTPPSQAEIDAITRVSGA